MLKSRGIVALLGMIVGAIAIYVVLSISSFNDIGQSRESTRLGAHAILVEQEEAWNNGDLPGFLKHYDMNDEITFYSDDRVSQGWVTISDRYTKKYGGGSAAMGKLAFSDLLFTVLASDAVMVRGRWTTNGTPNAGTGLFTILIRKTPQGWKIVHDHTSAKPEPGRN